MTLTQLEYIVALFTHRHFATAAEHCFVTQPTLSMQIQKLEEELGVQIFDRSRQPVEPTSQGLEIVEQARKVLSQRDTLIELIESRKSIVTGELKLSIIPTLAPYMLPMVIPAFFQKYPMVKLSVSEATTSNIIADILAGKIDGGILVTPLQEKDIKEHVLFYEEMLAYISYNSTAFKKQYVLPKDIDPDKLWLLEEGHCFRSQIIHLCELKKKRKDDIRFEYEASSLETLRRMADSNGGVTVLPELATFDMNGPLLKKLRHFKPPAPVREVSICVHKDFAKRRLIEALKQTILEVMPEKIRKNKKKNIIPVDAE